MSSVSPEESPVFNCSSLLTTSRDQDSECVRLGPAGWSGLGVRNIVMERQGAVGGCGCALICLNRLQLGGRCSYWQVDLVWTEGTSGFKSEPLPVIDKVFLHCAVTCFQDHCSCLNDTRLCPAFLLSLSDLFTQVKHAHIQFLLLDCKNNAKLLVFKYKNVYVFDAFYASVCFKAKHNTSDKV